jgi:hypothetical protein
MQNAPFTLQVPIESESTLLDGGENANIWIGLLRSGFCLAAARIPIVSPFICPCLKTSNGLKDALRDVIVLGWMVTRRRSYVF